MALRREIETERQTELELATKSQREICNPGERFNPYRTNVENRVSS